MVVIARRSGDVTTITPDAPEAFLAEMHERMAAAALPSRSPGESFWGGCLPHEARLSLNAGRKVMEASETSPGETNEQSHVA